MTALRNLGVIDLACFDEDQIDQLIINNNRLNNDLSLLGFESGRKFDLLLCVNVSKLIDQNGREELISIISQHSDTVLFSSDASERWDPEGFCKFHHDWNNRFKESGYEAWDVVRPILQDKKDIEERHKYNMFLYARHAHIDYHKCFGPHGKAITLPKHLEGRIQANIDEAFPYVSYLYATTEGHSRRFGAETEMPRSAEYCLIDCGTHFGQGLRQINRRLGLNCINNPRWDIYTFEANPHIDLSAVLKNVKNIIKVNRAVWIEDGYLDFKAQHGQRHGKITSTELRGQGSHLTLNDVRKQDWSFFQDKANYRIHQVPTFSFSSFLESLRGKYRKVICKMDIEGAEIKVLEHCIKEGSINVIDELYVELHERFNQELPEGKAGFPRNKWVKQKERQRLAQYRKYINKVVKWH